MTALLCGYVTLNDSITLTMQHLKQSFSVFLCGARSDVKTAAKSEILSHSSNRLTEVVLVLTEDALRLFGGCI